MDRSVFISGADLEPEEAADKAIPIFLSLREYEDRLVLVDYPENEWPR